MDLTARDAYCQVARRLAALLRDRSGQAGTQVPACPEWTIWDVVAHTSGICANNLALVLTAAGQPTRPAAREGLSLAEMVTEWEAGAEHVVHRISRFDLLQITMDALSHEFDIRVALGLPANRDQPAVQLVIGFVGSGFGYRLVENRLPAVQAHAGGRSWLFGEGEPGAQLRAAPYDLFRSLTGRRTASQIAALDWNVDPQPWLASFTWGPFTVPRQPVE